MDRLQDVLARVRRQFPGAKVKCSGLDEFVTHLLEIAPRLDLPVVRKMRVDCNRHLYAFVVVDGKPSICA